MAPNWKNKAPLEGEIEVRPSDLSFEVSTGIPGGFSATGHFRGPISGSTALPIRPGSTLFWNDLQDRTYPATLERKQDELYINIGEGSLPALIELNGSPPQVHEPLYGEVKFNQALPPQ